MLSSAVRKFDHCQAVMGILAYISVQMALLIEFATYIRLAQIFQHSSMCFITSSRRFTFPQSIHKGFQGHNSLHKVPSPAPNISASSSLTQSLITKPRSSTLSIGVPCRQNSRNILFLGTPQRETHLSPSGGCRSSFSGHTALFYKAPRRLPPFFLAFTNLDSTKFAFSLLFASFLTESSPHTLKPLST